MVAGDGSIYAASTPRGAVFRVLPDGRAERFGLVEARYIWALVDDGAGRVLAATGDPATLVRLDGSGEARVLFRAEAESHLTCLLPLGGGEVLAGSDGRGRVYRVDPSGDAAVLFDSPHREIADLTVGEDGTIWAVAVAHRPLVTERPRVRVRVPELPPGMAAGEGAVSSGSAGRTSLWGEIEGLGGAASEPEVARGGLLRFPPDGGVAEEVWSSAEETPTAVALARDGSVVVGTAHPARLYRVPANGPAERLADLAEGAVSSLSRDPRGGLVVATGQPGVLYRVLTVTADRGEYRSLPLDGGAGARWGSLRWDGEVPPGARLDLAVRSGESLPPGPGWSGWMPVSAVPGDAPLAVPPGRFLQVRAIFTRGEEDRSPVLRDLDLRLRPANRSPRLDSVGLELEAPRAEGAGDPPRWLARWTGADPDRDPLHVTLELGASAEGPWELLASGRLEPPVPVALAGRPAGSYRLRVTLDDRPANLPGEGRRVSLAGGPVRYHPDPPTLGELRLERLADGGWRASAEADAGGDCLVAAWASGDGGESWWPAGAADGVLDGPRDTVVAFLPSTSEGDVILRVRDGSGSEIRGSAPLR
jgi:hypothetical protein